MTSPHGCGKSQGGGRPDKLCSLPRSADPAYFWSVPVWAAVAPHQPELVVPRFNGAFRHHPDAICQRAGDSMQCASCVPLRCHTGTRAVKRALPTDSAALLRSAKQPARRSGST
jgi:hypothetical protein